MTPKQCKAARALLGWDQHQLAQVSNISVSTIRDFERKARDPTVNNMVAMQRAFAEALIVFIETQDGLGVMLRSISQKDGAVRRQPGKARIDWARLKRIVELHRSGKTFRHLGLLLDITGARVAGLYTNALRAMIDLDPTELEELWPLTETECRKMRAAIERKHAESNG